VAEIEEKITTLDETKSNTRAQANAKQELRITLSAEYDVAVKAVKSAESALVKLKQNHDYVSKKEVTYDEGLLLDKWQSQTFEKSNSDKSIKDSDEKWERSSSAEKDIDRIFDNPDLPKPGFSEELKDPIPTEKEMFDNRMLAEATTPKPESVKPWWCFWC